MFGERIVGMNRRQNPAQLLSMVGNKLRPNKVAKAVDDPPLSSDEEEDNEAVTDNHQDIVNPKNDSMPPREFKIPKAFDDFPASSHKEERNDAVPPPPLEFKVPRAFGDPPVSSEEAGNEAVTDNQLGSSNAKRQTAARHGPGSDRHPDAIHDSSGSSGDERAARANIKRSNFVKAAGTSKFPRRTRKSDDIESLESETKPCGNAQTAGSKRRRLSEKTPATYGQGKAAHQTPSNSGGHQTDEHGFTKRKTSKTTYGKKNTNAKGETEKKAAATVSKSILKIPVPFDSPEKPKSSKLRFPSGSAPLSPPERRSGKLVLKDHKDDISSPEAKSILHTRGFKGKGPHIMPPVRRTQKKPTEPPRAPSPPPAVFKLPAHISELARRTGDDNGGPDGELPGILSDTEGDGRPSDGEAIGVGEEPVAAATVCPWCGEDVDKALLDESSKGKRMNVRQQTRFCQKHRKQTAVETWQANGYPEVDWQDLDKRFAEHHALLLDVVNGKSSHFRSILGEKIQSGKARSMKKEDNLNPGYYGPRGFNLMCDYLVDEFGDLLKEKAVDDRVIAGRGSAAFIQSVLVAELAVQLIKDDMRVSVDEARDILEESKALGEMVHEEV